MKGPSERDPSLPPAATKGVSFLEFATDAATAPALAALIEGLGFQHAGTHRTKDVELYAQGPLRLVLKPNGVPLLGPGPMI